MKTIICCSKIQIYVLLILCFIGINNKAQGQNGFEGESKWSSQIGFSTNIVGDFNGDGMSDIAYYAGGNGIWNVMLSSGNSFSSPQTWTSGQAVNNGVWAGDFNGDGLCDKISYVHSSSYAGFWVALSGRETNITSPTIPYYRFYNEYRWTTQTVDYPDKILIADFNGDAKDDIAYYKYDETVGGQWYIMLSNGGTFIGGSFASPTRWNTGFAWNNGTWAGDFNGDGKIDIVTQVYSDDATYKGWWVGLANWNNSDYYFQWGGRWSTEKGSLTGVLVGDFNGDSKSDIAYHIPSTGVYPDCWRVITSTGTQFNSSVQWTSGQSINNGVWAGDFNGDGLYDKVTYTNANGYGWYVAKTNDTRLREVGVWYSANNNWSDILRDPLKDPVVGWGSDAVTVHSYDSGDTTVIRKQFIAMKNAGIDFVVMDLTNGLSGSNGDPTGPVPGSLPNPIYGEPYYGDIQSTNNTVKVFQWAREWTNSNPSISIPKIALGLGMEFWGKNTFCGYGIAIPSENLWNLQMQRQSNAVNWIKDNLANTLNSNVYYKYLNKPLLIATMGSFTDYPFRDENWVIRNRQVFPEFTVRYGAEWGATYAKWHGVITTNYSCDWNGQAFIEGSDTKRLWNWGAGAPEASPDHNRPLPVSTELMSIMPGSHNIWMPGADGFVDRHNGDYYINSWKQVIAAMPKKVLIGNWNNWNEETSIEGCMGTNGWKDYCTPPHSTYDWYLQITKAYSAIFKTGIVPSGTYVRDESENAVFLTDGYSLIYQSVLPHGKPVIVLPSGWLDIHGYSGYPNPFLKKTNNHAEVPIIFELKQNHPNPFNPSTLIRYSLPTDEFVSLKIYDILGREVMDLVRDYQTAGYKEVLFDASNLPSGIYVYRISAGKYNATRKMLLLR